MPFRRRIREILSSKINRKSELPADFTSIIPWKGMPFYGIIRGKFWLSAGCPVMPFSGTTLSVEYPRPIFHEYLKIYSGRLSGAYEVRKNRHPKIYATVPLSSLF
jgi:hypothetical protein